jgi:hypothetical protein
LISGACTVRRVEHFASAANNPWSAQSKRTLFLS